MTFLDLFSGIGGFRLAMEQAGHICVGHCEIDKFANASYIAMHRPKEEEWYADDITRVRAEDVPRVDCWCFGFPCQDISVAGKQQGFRGHRSSLFFEVTRIIRGQKEESKPSYLLIENVKNLLSVNRGRDFASVLLELDEIGYDAEWAVLNSADVLPQNRERIFIIGHLRGQSTRKVFPIGEADRVATDKGTGLQNSHCVATVLRATDYKGTHNVIAIPVLTPDRKSEQHEKALGGIYIWASSKFNRGILYGLSRCLKSDKHDAGIVLQERGRYRIRKLTPKECFRLQGFPDDYFERAREVCSDTQLYKQAGNSVTVPVVYEIAKRMKVGA